MIDWLSLLARGPPFAKSQARQALRGTITVRFSDPDQNPAESVAFSYPSYAAACADYEKLRRLGLDVSLQIRDSIARIHLRAGPVSQLCWLDLDPFE